MKKAETKISEDWQNLIQSIDALIESTAGQPMNFSLLVFPANEGGRMSYGSNCDREYVIGAVESLLKGWKEGMPDIAAHKYND